MSLFLYCSADTSSQTNHYILPELDRLFVDTCDIYGFAPHWQITSLYAAIKKANMYVRDQDFWVRRAIDLIGLCATTAIYTASPFIVQNNTTKKLIENIQKHLTKTSAGRMGLNSIPGYPTNMKLFNEQFIYCLLPIQKLFEQLDTNTPTFEFNTLVNKIASNEAVYVNVYNALKMSDQQTQQQLIESLLAWLMTHSNVQHRSVSVILDSSLCIDDIDPELYIQMAINGLTLKKHHNSKTTNCLSA